ncbi:MAG: hypothetical protein U9P80_07380 [Thermodesulfobacteriota bacterium]|nr:hypothetical protein [Thermodesulfobacteriota bacterium]
MKYFQNILGAMIFAIAMPWKGMPWKGISWESLGGNMESTTKGQGFYQRMIRAARLDVGLYEEVEADRDATFQAAMVVILSSVAAGIGSITEGSIGFVLMSTVGALLSWCVWAFITYIIGAKMLPEPQTSADYGELLRTIGFSSSPGIIRILGIIPGLFGIVSLVASIWMLVAMVIAVRQALDYHSTFRAVGVCIIGWIVQALCIAFVLFGIAGMGMSDF